MACKAVVLTFYAKICSMGGLGFLFSVIVFTRSLFQAAYYKYTDGRLQEASLKKKLKLVVTPALESS